MHYDVDLFRNVDVYHSQPLEQEPDYPPRRGRTMVEEEKEKEREWGEGGDLTVSGDVVEEAQYHSRPARSLQVGGGPSFCHEHP